MPPNIIDVPMQNDPENHIKETKGKEPTQIADRDTNGDYKLKVFNSTLNLLAHVLIGAVVGISFAFAFRNGLPLGATPLHIVLCVTGVSFLLVF